MSLKLPRNWDFATFKAETARIGSDGTTVATLTSKKFAHKL